jgi:hypothetical protein
MVNFLRLALWYGNGLIQHAEELRTFAIMVNFLRLVLWNANVLIQHGEELRTFISLYNINVMLISETHFTEKSYLILLNYIQSTTPIIQPELL